MTQAYVQLRNTCQQNAKEGLHLCHVRELGLGHDCRLSLAWAGWLLAGLPVADQPVQLAGLTRWAAFCWLDGL